MEQENRKVLISVKVSTLLLIVLSIIAIIVVTVVVKNKLETSSSVANAENVQYENPEVNEPTENVEEKRTIKANITSRYSESRNEEESDSSGYVGKINFDTVEHSVEEDIVENTVEEIKTTPIEEVTIAKDMNLTVRTGLSREDFITLMAGVEEDRKNFFEENAGLIYDICEKYEINEIFFCGLIAGESGWHISDNHRRTHNYISLMSSKGLIRYESVEAGLEAAAKALHNNYLTEGGRFYNGPTLAGVKTRFCPASSTWVNLIFGNMKTILN